ncbi:DUF4175 domain-containing protein [Alkalicaulis satelles]|uniref:DUF4175 domain-containing protein n=1 Tax=Alkalicaulis satelles TaxID=2609175 RepID=A0A5M6ZGV4_9PROT|nr:DUF4175 family protein [Alkalicaulis satelles]KAA5803996.1 DUF4175 domain-containing protein [Alkalicaulis satelles]
MTRAERRLAAQIATARAALLWERAAPVLAAPLAALIAYLILAVFGVFERLGDPWRVMALLALIAAGAWGALIMARGWRWPSAREAERRLEADSGLDGRPIEALRDAPARAGKEGWWAAHRARMAARLGTARVRRPRAAWAQMDPWGLRLSALVVFASGVFLAGDLAAPRLSEAFSPRPLAGGSALGASVEMWIEPPAYTGRPVMYLRDRREARAPEGSVLAVRIAGLARDPSVHGAPAELEALSRDVRQLRITPDGDGEILIRAGGLRERVNLTLIEDRPPEVRLAAEPSGDAQGRLVLEIYAEDDYGVEALAFEFAPEAGGPHEHMEIPPGAVTDTGDDGLKRIRLDLSRHALAGERVTARVAAFDAIGQRGASGEISLTLPQRVFLNPLARAVASERRRFIQVGEPYAPMPDTVSVLTLADAFVDDQPDRRIDRAPPGVQRLALALDAVSDAPHPYFDDPVVWMGLRTALREVRRARELDALAHLDEDLWQIALRAELGSLADAEAALRAAEEALMDALARGADPIELAALFDAFERAVQVYMQALAREAAEAGRFAEGNGAAGMSGMDANALQELLDAIREAAELGDTSGSRQALAQLAELLRNMQLTLSQGGGGGEADSPMARALREALEELSEAIGEQRSLSEDTFQRDRQGGGAGAPPPPGADAVPEEDEDGTGEGARPDETGPADFADLAERQRALRDRLENAEEALSMIPGERAQDALEAARRAMDAAERALRQGDAERALSDQDEAVRALREASREAAEALEQEGQGEGGDPLGREGGVEGETAIPSEAERQRARDILEELRRRAAERGRPQEELDYIDRLLERFRR